MWSWLSVIQVMGGSHGRLLINAVYGAAIH